MNLAPGDGFQSREPISCAHFTAASSLMTQEQPVLLTFSNSGILKTLLVLPGLPLTQEKVTFETLKRIRVCMRIVSIHMRAGMMLLTVRTPDEDPSLCPHPTFTS